MDICLLGRHFSEVPPDDDMKLNLDDRYDVMLLGISYNLCVPSSLS